MDTKSAQYRLSASMLGSSGKNSAQGIRLWSRNGPTATLANITKPPTLEVSTDETLTITSLAPEFGYELQYSTLTAVDNEEKKHGRYGYSIHLTRQSTVTEIIANFSDLPGSVCS